MFAKDASGDLKADASNAVAQTVSAKELSDKHIKAVDGIATKITVSGKTDETALKAFFTCSGFKQADTDRLASKYKGMTSEEFNKSFARDFGWLAPSYSEKCAKP